MTSTDNYGTPDVPHVVLSAGYNAAGLMTSQSATVERNADFLNKGGFIAAGHISTSPLNSLG